MNPYDCKFETDARSFTQSTMSYISVIGLQRSLKELIELDPFVIENHGKKIANLLFQGLENSDWSAVKNMKENCSSFHIVSLENETIDPAAVNKMLKEANIICSFRGGRIRVSLAHYNNAADVNKLLEVLNSIK